MSTPLAPQDFAGQVALVTGGGGGIGAAVGTTLARRGCRVCLCDLSEGPLRTALSELQKDVPGADAMIATADVADVKAAQGAIRAAVARWGRLDVLVQCAGVTGKTGVTTDVVDPDNFDFVLRVNLRGIFCMCRAALPVMKKQGYGRIVNIASVAGKEGNAGMLAYSASKAAVIGLTKVIGKEFAEGPGDIKCNAVAPAVVRTAMVAAMPDQQVKYMTDKIPMKRCGDLHEVADTVCFAASRACSFTTGFCFDTTGGRSTY
jgi:3-oxoacyl-[acyl-carrier protein] reductase